MKQAILNLKKKLLLVELPEGITDVHVSAFYKSKVSYKTKTSLHFIEPKENLLSDSCELIGKLTDITEQQFKEWVEKNYPHYCFNEGKFKIKCKTAKESFFSYLESQGVVFENPLGEFPTKHNTGLEYGMQYISKVESWEEAQENVWDITRTYLFEIL